MVGGKRRNPVGGKAGDVSSPRSGRVGDFPESDDREVSYQVAQTTLGAVDVLLPGAGYALQQVVNRAIGSPLERRRTDWIRKVGEGLQELQSRLDGFDPAALGENEEFVSAVYEATQLAMRTHREEKREALLNFVLNSAAGLSIDEVLRDTFIDYIDRFSGLHIHVLRLLSDPSKSPEMVSKASSMYAGSQMSVLRAALPETEVPKDLLDRVLGDLSGERLIEGSLNTMGTSGMFLAKRTTSVGDSFLQFISSPLTDSS